MAGPRGAFSNTDVSKRPTCPTPLRAWRGRNNVSIAGFAVLVGCNVRTAENWDTGRCLPSIVYAFKIEEVTGGEVAPSMWLGTENGRAAWAAIGRVDVDG